MVVKNFKLICCCWSLFFCPVVALIDLLHQLRRSGKINLWVSSVCLRWLSGLLTFQLFVFKKFFFSFCFNRKAFDNCNWEKLELKNDMEIFSKHQNCEVIPFSTWAISSNKIYRCVALCFFFARCLSQFQLWIAFPTNVRTRLFVCPATFRKSWLVLFKRHFFGNCFLCSCCLNTTVDTSNWEKFDIQRFWNFILTDLKDINVRFFCSRFWELVVTRYTM